MDKRSSSRVDFTADAKVTGPGFSIDGKISNLSLKGMYFETDREIVLETPVEIVIGLDQGDEHIDLELQGLVVRTEPGGWGVLFTSMGLQAFTHLRNVVIYNYGQDEQIMEEMRRLMAMGLNN